MPINRIFWSGGKDRDLHVVSGRPSPNLTLNYLAFGKSDGTVEWASQYLAANGDVTLVFTPLFKTQGAQPADTHKGFGISVHTKSGVITLDAALPNPTKRNFIMEVTATDTSVPATPKVFTEYIRVHVHQSVTKLWLTPATLTVRPSGVPRPETTEMKFLVRAQFDDGVVGDITDMSGLTWSPIKNVNDVTGQLAIDAGDAAGAIIPITVKLPAALGGATATANMKIGTQWSIATPVSASIVAGGGWPGTLEPQSAPNVLFLGDGFAATEEARFRSYVNSLVQYLKTNPVNKPYDVLATSINFWTAFVPSPSTGVTIRAEVYPVGTGAAMTARFVPGPERPPTPHAGNYTLGQLLYVVGLPIPSDDAGIAGRTNAAIKAEWTALITPDPGPKVNDALITSWRGLAKRALIDAVDSPLGVCVGDNISNPNSIKNITLDDRRVKRDKIDQLMRSLSDPRGIPIQDLWAKRADNSLPKDYDLVCILVAGTGRALNGEGYFFVDVLDTLKIAPIAGTNAFKLNYVPADIPNSSDNGRGRTLAHELTHSFTVGDEYGEREQMPPTVTLAVVDKYANLTREVDVQRGADTHGDEVKWNWHRIRKAGVISAAITDAGGGKFRIPLKLSHGYQFAVGDTVHLRVRQYPQPLKKNPPLSAPLEITDPAPAADAIHVRLKAGAVFNYPNLIQPAQYLATFLAGSIVYIPTPAPASVLDPNAYPYAEMIAKHIKEYITTNKKPLTAFPSVVDTNTPQIPIIPGVSLPDCYNKHRPRIVGLYSGGMTYHKGLFHPTGNCIMRESHTDGREFCAVCRYILVDLIDPFHHWAIDREYNKVYPLV
ncbi:MAG: hypothetical protein IT282_12375 [Bacteroidetes bacterium]|nr:hypothetical protein [Bacteroidota bacterium]